MSFLIMDILKINSNTFAAPAINNLNSSETPSSHTSNKTASQAIKLCKELQTKDRLERSSRLSSEIDQSQTLTNLQKECLRKVLSSSELYTDEGNDLRELPARLHTLALQEMQTNPTSYSLASENLSLLQCAKLVEPTEEYNVKPLNLSSFDKEKTKKSQDPQIQDPQIIEARYGRELPIPAHILEFDTSANHTLIIDKYLDVRISRTIVDAIQSVQKTGKNVEIFIGSKQDLMAYYVAKGYYPAAQLLTNSTTQYFIFASEDPASNKLVIATITSQSRLNKALLQLKFLNADLNKVAIRGSLHSMVDTQILELQKTLMNYRTKGAEPTLAFIGTSWLIIKQLAKHLYPNQIKSNLVRDQQTEVRKALKKHNYKICNVGDMFIFSSATVNIKGKPGTVLTFRMPNGNLSGLVTEQILKSGVKYLCMTGAGGSLDKDLGGDIGALQIVEKSTYQGRELSLPAKFLMPIPNEELIGLDTRRGSTNITVDGPLQETNEWLTKAKKEKQHGVDVETHHILNAILHAQRDDASILPGLFISDVVGEKPLQGKISGDNAYVGLPILVGAVFKHVHISR